MKLDLRKKISLIGAAQLVAVSGVLLYLYQVDAKEKTLQQYVGKARSIVLTAEATREEMGKKWDQGLFNAEQLSEWSNQGHIDKILATVPVVTAWQAAMAKSEEGGYQLRVPKFQPRNPKNEPDQLEARVLKMLKQEDLAEHYEVDESINAVRYFRPIKLTQECLLCHGDPVTASELWGNSDGLDPTGVKMEDWKVGEIHGAFEVVQSLDEADAQMAASIRNAAWIVAGLVVAGTAIFFFLASRGINGLYRPIRRVASTLYESANQVSEAATQVSGSSQQLAEGAGEQASSLEQTSAALEQMAAMTRTNAENAKQANDLSNQAKQAAEGGNQTMGQLNAAMSAINDSSGQIGKIIKVIEEIAFQTNLLALNAAVEAARAGEHGKGFAVVADEVRNLAQRAAQAARETTGLIENSVNKVKEGTEVAADVGTALSAIVTDVTKVSDLIDGISKASDEQAQGVDQVNAAVAQMDKVTQQNAAGAEEAASAAEQLTAQSQSVKSMVDELVSLVGGGQGDKVRTRRSSTRRTTATLTPAGPQLASRRPLRTARAPSQTPDGDAADDFMALDDQPLSEF